MPKDSVMSKNAVHQNKDSNLQYRQQLIDYLLISQDNENKANSDANSRLIKGIRDYLNASNPITNSTEKHHPNDDFTKLVEQVANQNSISLSEQQNKLLELMEKLFSFVTAEFAHKPVVKLAIERLSTPYFLLLLEQPLLLCETDYSAKNLLNDIAKVGLFWEADDPKSDHIMEQISLTLSQLTQVALSQEDLAGAFDSASIHFRRFSESLLKRAEIFEKRIREAEEGKAKTTIANSSAQLALAEITCKKAIPAFIQSLFDEAWQHIVFLDILKHQNSENWHTLYLAKSLLVSIQPVNTIDELEKFIELQPFLIEELTNELEKSSYSFAEISAFFTELDEVHAQLVENAKISLEKQPKEEILRLKPTTAFSIDKENEEPLTIKPIRKLSLTQWVKSVFQRLPEHTILPTNDEKTSVTRLQKELDANKKLIKLFKPGCWIILNLAGVENQYKIASYLQANDKYIVVNASGNKIAEFNSQELIILYQNKQVSLVDDKPLVDRAFQSIFKDLALNLKSSTKSFIAASNEHSNSQIPAKHNKVQINQKTNQQIETVSIDIEDNQAAILMATQSSTDSIAVESEETYTKNAKIISQLTVGSWVEMDINNKVQKCRLAAKINASGKHIFTDRAGVKVKECFTEELIARYTKGELIFELQSGMFDKALESVISNMRNKKSEKE